MDDKFFERIKDLGVFQFCKKHNLVIGEVEEKRIKEYLEIVQDCPILGLSLEQEKEIIIGYIQGLGVDLYWKVNYSVELMRLLRHCLENNIPIVQLMHRAVFTDNDIKAISIAKSTYELKQIMNKRKNKN